MIRARKLANVHQKRSLRPLYAHTSAIPFACFLDTGSVTSSTVVWPGMVAKKGVDELVRLAVTDGDIPFGLFANFINGDFDELGDSTECSVWRGGPDAEFEVLSDALEAANSWTGLDSSLFPFIYSSSNAKLTTGASGANSNAPTSVASTSLPVARLVSAPSNNKIIIALYLGARGPSGAV